VRPLLVALLVGMVAVLTGCRTAGRPLFNLFPRGDLSRLAAQATSPDPDLRREAALALGRRPLKGKQAEDVRELLATLLRQDTEALVRSAAAVSLGRLGGEPSVAALTAGRSDASELVRADVCRGLGMTAVPSAVAPLAALLEQDANVDVRCAAARALGEFTGAEARQALLEALDSKRMAVRTAGCRALCQSTGAKGVPPERAAWEKWLADHKNPQQKRRHFLFW